MRNEDKIQKPITVKVQRLWIGKASVRDYIVLKAVEERKDLVIILLPTKERMTIPYGRLHEGKESPEIFKSKIDKKLYRLIDFKWKPNKVLDLNNPETFATLIL